MNEYELTKISINGENIDETIEGSIDLMDMIYELIKDIHNEKHIITECNISIVHKHEKEDNKFMEDFNGDVFNAFRFSENTNSFLNITYDYQGNKNEIPAIQYMPTVDELKDPYKTLISIMNDYNGKKIRGNTLPIIMCPITAIAVKALNLDKSLSVREVIKAIFISRKYREIFPYKLITLENGEFVKIIKES